MHESEEGGSYHGRGGKKYSRQQQQQFSTRAGLEIASRSSKNPRVKPYQYGATMGSNTTTTSVVAASLGFVAGTVLGTTFWQWYQNAKQEGKTTSKTQKVESSSSASSSSSSCVYLDYNGTTPIYPHVLEAMMPYFQTHFGNPSSSHSYATEPRQAIDRARAQVLYALLQANPDTTPTSSIWFTSCGTESDNLAIHLALQRSTTPGSNAFNGTALPHIVTCNIEHPAVEACLKDLEAQGRCTVSFVPVQADGRVLAMDVIHAITPQTVLVTLMTANNEVGSIQPIREVSQYCHEHNIWCHTDAAQAAGKVSVSLESLGHPDLISLVGHKLGAPKGVACLYVSPNCLNDLKSTSTSSSSHGILMIGGNQEFGFRAGTQNTPYIVGMGVAASTAAQHLENNAAHMEQLRSQLLQLLQDALGHTLVRTNGPSAPSARLPNTLSVGLRGVHSGRLLQTLADHVAASAGATCHSTEQAPISSVLQAMGVPEEFARGTLRLSLGPKTTVHDVERAAQLIAHESKRQLGIL